MRGRRLTPPRRRHREVFVGTRQFRRGALVPGRRPTLSPVAGAPAAARRGAALAERPIGEVLPGAPKSRPAGAFVLGAGDGNRTRTVSLGELIVMPPATSSLQVSEQAGVSASVRNFPAFAGFAGA